MDIPALQVKALREKTGAGMMDCKRALVDAAGDEEKAVLILRERGLAKALSKGARVTREGVITPYVHGSGRIGVLLELACETDFVARNAQFQTLAKELAMQVAAMNPITVSPTDLPAKVIETERELYRQQVADKPDAVQDKIIEGKLEKFYEQACLLKQPYIRDETRKVEQVIQEAIAKLGENIEVARFVRMELGRRG